VCEENTYAVGKEVNSKEVRKCTFLPFYLPTSLPPYFPESDCYTRITMTNARKPIIAANWKMNPAPQGYNTDDSPFRPREDVDVIVFPAHTDLHACVEAFLNTGAQSGRPERTGAFTGDISMHLIATRGCRYVLCGHSERRIHHAENDAFVAEQAIAAIAENLLPIVCVGETADEREMGKAKEVVRRQLDALFGSARPSDLRDQLIIAYEPVWAIGTGKTATPADAQEMHAFIRTILPADMRPGTRILYGGSVKPATAAELIAQSDIDGFLVGGASLEIQSFRQIVDTCINAA
jgi:triosephosphate isomerase